MTYSQPQQPTQGQGRPNRLALWVNSRKSAANQPDYKGHVEISWDLLQELNAAFNAGRYGQDYGGRPCIKLDVGIYAQQPSADGKKPVMSGHLSTVAETEHSAAMREQARQQAQGGYQQQPMAPQGYAQQQPVQQYAPQQPAPAPMPASQPMPQPQAPAPAPAPVYQQQPMPQVPAPVAAPMPGAIHGQAPAAPVAPGVPPGF